jgi:hypothetical protein
MALSGVRRNNLGPQPARPRMTRTCGSRLALAPWPARTVAGEKTPLQTPVATHALVNPRAIVRPTDGYSVAKARTRLSQAGTRTDRAAFPRRRLAQLRAALPAVWAGRA